MGKVLAFPGCSVRVEERNSQLDEARQLMLRAAEKLSGAGEIENEIAWLLEDLVEFLEQPSDEPRTSSSLFD